MIRYVPVLTGNNLAELQCVTHPDLLYCDPNLHAPVSFGRDEDAARVTYIERVDQYHVEAGRLALAANSAATPSMR